MVWIDHQYQNNLNHLIKILGLWNPLHCLCLHMLSPWSCSRENKIQMLLLNLVSVEKQLFLLFMCACSIGIIKFQFFSNNYQTMNMGNIRNKKFTLVKKETCEAMCFGSKGNSRVISRKPPYFNQKVFN